MSEGLAEAKRALLSLIGGQPPRCDPRPLDWREVFEMAAAHRLEPFLAWRLERGDCSAPSTVAASWREARRRGALLGLAHQAALRLALDRLGASHVPVVALKGVALAWRYYPEPSLRPMRDLDVLVPAERALEAAELLADAGFARESADPRVLADALAASHELPSQRHPRLGVTIELHHRLTDPPHRRGYFMPQLSAPDVLARAVAVDCGGLGVPCPSPQDLAAHLIVHAAYGHRFDCGPLVLADLHFLSADPTIDWARLREDAQRQGWARGFDLLLALTSRWFGSSSGGFEPPPDPILDAAEQALVPDPAARHQTLAAADFAGARTPAAIARAVARRLAPGPEVVASEGGGRPMAAFWPVWATRRIARLAGGLADRRARSEAQATARVMRWLEAGAQFSGH